MLKEMTPKHLNKLHTTDGSCVVFFYTPLCGTCKLADQMLKVAVKALETEAPEVYECNLNINPEAAVRWKIESVPCLLFFKDGKVVERLYSMHSMDHLYEKLKTFKKKQ